MSPRNRAVLYGLVGAVAFAVRLLPWSSVFTEGGLRLLADTDPHYHVLRAERILRGDGAVWRDPNLDWPNGADVPWPPLFDALLAGAAAAAAGTWVDRYDIAEVAAFVPPFLGVVASVLGGLLAAALAGEGAGIVAALFLAVLPAAADVTTLGRPDQHALELPLAAGTWLAFAVGWRAETRRGRASAMAAGSVLVALCFWNWMGSALVLVFPAAAVAALHVGRGADGAAARALAGMCAGGAALLAASVWLVCPPGTLERTGIVGVGGLHVAIVAGCAAFASLLALASRAGGARGLPRRSAELLLALAVPAAALLGVWPGLRDGAYRGLVALSAGDPWYDTIAEFEPLVGSGDPLVDDLVTVLGLYGLLPVLVAVGVRSLSRRWRAEPGERSRIAVLLLWAALAISLALARRRFGPYAVLVVSALGALGVRPLVERLPARLAARAPRTAAAGVILAVALSSAWYHLVPFPAVSEPTIEALQWIGRQPQDPAVPAGVAGHWDLGHAVQFYARRPTLTSPFGTEAGVQSLRDWGAFLLASDEEGAEAVLRARSIGVVVLTDGLGPFFTMQPFAPSGTAAAVVAERRLLDGTRLVATERFPALVAARLMAEDGLASRSGAPALGAFRLLYEAGEDAAHTPDVKVFGVVPGARVIVERALPGATVSARVLVTTARGRSFEYRTGAAADALGRATLRVPYATGWNGASAATALLVSDGAAEGRLEVPERAVIRGLTLHAALESGRDARNER